MAAGALLLAACGGGGGSKTTTTSASGGSSTTASSSTSSTASAGNIQQGGTATMALPPNATPNYIFPMDDPGHFSVYNISNLQYLLYKPLFYFGKGQNPVVNLPESVGNQPTWSSDGKTVTVTLKNYTWSNGKPVTAQDVQFWQNMITANKANWAAYVPGSYPDNVVSTTVVNPKTIQFHLNKAYSHKWFLYNELSQVTPMPMAWDVTAVNGAPGSGGCTASAPKKCVAVYNFLTAQAKKGVSTYASSPIWTIVDGPWKLQSIDNTGKTVMVPNPKYTGPDKPHLSKFVQLPFTTDTAEYNQLRSGNGIDIGYIPNADVAQKSLLANKGYTFKPWIDFGFNYFVTNMNNPKVGKIFSQAYIRQVLEELINQQGDIQAYYKGYGYPTCGSVPTKPSSNLISPYEKSCPFSFNPQKAISTLKSHGWNVVPGGVDTCKSPGSGANQCGAGIAAGAKLEFQYVYATGNAAVTHSIEQEKSDSAKAGVKLDLSGTTFDHAISTSVPCKPSEAKCSWEIVNWGGGWVYAPDYYPTGGELFLTGAGANYPNYTNPTMDALINKTHLEGNDLQNLYKYEDFVAKQLPYIWTPQPDYSLTEVNNKLHGFTYNTFLNILPAKWYFTK